ncbi:hypothetical protein [Kitasatospora viridis]|uniref:Uncharacterized protein n=1 Tax=Kitasatospora viridis TaxID=281105 RepID=A0A561UM53_9ACTN|nr:hypothetical protein [Kitasatospora viridis]TWG00445.1 hypothetical protein FHX73_114323 [Kitasatospora viridis]
MGIGMLVLYAALAVVALWLVAELLLQSRAPLHWRGLALGAFLLVVVGMAAHTVVLIGIGALGFAAGQLLVTLAVKAGKTTAWSLRGSDGALPGPLAKVPLLAAATSGDPAPEVVVERDRIGEVGPIEEPAATAEPLPEPVLPEDDGDYGIYDTADPYGYGQEQQQSQQVQYDYSQQQQQGYGYYDPNQYQQPQQQPQYQGYQEYYPGQDQQQWQQQPAYDPNQYQGGYDIPQQQSHEYYQPQPQPQVQPEYPQQTDAGWHGGWQ